MLLAALPGAQPVGVPVPPAAQPPSPADFQPPPADVPAPQAARLPLPGALRQLETGGNQLAIRRCPAQPGVV